MLFNKDRFVANKYFHLLVTLVVTLFFAPQIEQGMKLPGLQLMSYILILMLVFCLRAVVKNRKLFWACISIVILQELIEIFVSLLGQPLVHERAAGINHLISCAFFAMTIVLLMRSMFKSRKVDEDTIVGGICIYLLIGIQWGLAYIFYEHHNVNSFALKPGDSLFYFSYTTLTTTGYGDIVPKSNPVKMLAMFEAICGQVYLAIFVARLVGLHIAEKTFELRQERLGQKSEEGL